MTTMLWALLIATLLSVGIAIYAQLAASSAARSVSNDAASTAVKEQVRQAQDIKRFALVAGSVIFGLLLIALGYSYVDAPTDLRPQQYQIVRMVIGLAGGFIAAGLSGTFEISSGDIANAAFKATGPIGVTIFFYLVNPLGFAVA